MPDKQFITPIIITPGDPAGIGPEIALKALDGNDDLRAQSVLIGDKSHLSSLAEALDISCQFAKWTPGDPLYFDKINLAEISWPEAVISGAPSTANAPMVIEAIATAAHLALAGDVRAIVTCPIAKSTLYEAGFQYPGHTEYLGALSSDKSAIMMLANSELRVVPATIHIALSDVPKQINESDLSELIKDIAGALQQDFGLSSPRIGVCGLNPHAGENGAMGDEEQRILMPAIKHASDRLDGKAIITGPHPADTLFHQEKRRQFDCIIGMYHDQVLIPVKTLDFHGSVNITLGLDFIRTSPDHGTAFDIAGKGIARDDSLRQAITTALKMAEHRYGVQDG